MKTTNTMRTLAALAFICTLGLFTPTASAQYVTNNPELDRLVRKSYDYYYRNSNNNVFRKSRHFSPEGNVFRRSRYYQRRLAAGYASRPIRTTERHVVTVDGGKPRVIEYDYAHPRRSPIGPNVGGYFGFSHPYAGAYASGPLVIDNDHQFRCPPKCGGPIVRLPRSRTQPRAEPVERIVAVQPARPATQKPVMKTVTLADGTQKTVITSVPIDTPTEAQAEAKADAGEAANKESGA